MQQTHVSSVSGIIAESNDERGTTVRRERAAVEFQMFHNV